MQQSQPPQQQSTPTSLGTRETTTTTITIITTTITNIKAKRIFQSPVVSQYLHQRYVQISLLGQAFPLSHERARRDTSTRITCLLLDASSDSSSYTSARSASRRARLHDPRTPATTSRTLAQACNGLTTSAPVVQLSHQIQESATSVCPHIHAGQLTCDVSLASDTNAPANGLSIASFSCVSFAHSLLWCITICRITL